MGLAFTQDAHAGIADGSITVTYRAWKRPQVKVGGKYRFHRVEPVAKAALSNEETTKRLDRLDAASTHGPWTRTTLALIRDHPGLVSTRLAELVDRERFAFKADVRKLKALGLTESLEVGYRLSPRGRAYLDRTPV